MVVSTEIGQVAEQFNEGMAPINFGILVKANDQKGHIGEMTAEIAQQFQAALVGPL